MFPILKSKLKSVNFVYGELSFYGMCRVLGDYAHTLAASLLQDDFGDGNNTNKSLCFVDLGSGAGASVAAAALSGLFTTVIGIEMMRTKVNICRFMIKHLQALGAKHILFDFGASDEPTIIRTDSDVADSINNEIPPCKVDIVEGDFLLYPWWKIANVVYTACTCFSDDLMERILEKCLELKIGSLIVLLDRPVLADRADQFALVGSFATTASWGETYAFVYSKI